MGSSSFEVLIHDATPGVTACGSTTPCTERWGDYLNVAQDPINHSTSEPWGNTKRTMECGERQSRK